MILKMLRGTLVLVTSAVLIPYTIAIVCNILYGWPQTKNKYSRALNPRKVINLNYVLFQMLRDKGRYLFLYLKWKSFYNKADPSRLYKNIAFGRNDCTLDVYLPCNRNPSANLPVVVFVYGGSWSSGGKSSYGLLCSNIVAHTQSIAVCPNYSYYPKGYVDDMIQDIVDCVSWVVDNIQEYGGDKKKIILIGHSAGAHLSMMAILELLHDERLSIQSTFKFIPTSSQYEDLPFAESHYGKRKGLLDVGHESHEDSSGSSESFAVVSDSGAYLEQSGSTDSRGASLFGSTLNSERIFNAKVENDGKTVNVTESEGQENEEEKEKIMIEPEDTTITASSSDESENKEYSGHQNISSNSGSQGDDEEEEDSGDNDSVITVRPKDIDRHVTLVDLCKAVKAFIGLAGVYSIKDHFQHEASRGVEDVSCMCRAHYGEDHFARFSPKEIVRSLKPGLSLPLIVLAHGTEDYVTPLSASLSFADALSEISANVKMKIIPECNHYEICLDLMDTSSKFYSHVMNVIMETINTVS